MKWSSYYSRGINPICFFEIIGAHKEFFNEIIRSTKKEGDLLEIGSGTGLMSVFLVI